MENRTEKRDEMLAVQQGVDLDSTLFYRDLPSHAWLNPIKFEEQESWKMIDSFIVRAISYIAVVDDRSQISFAELVKRLKKELHMDEEYLITNIPRYFREPPNGITGHIKRMSFRD